MKTCGWLSVVLAACSGMGSPEQAAGSPPGLRGVWMHATRIPTPAQADACVAKIDDAHLNAVFLLVWYWGGEAYFKSQLCPMAGGLSANYDPLACFTAACHRRHIEVHAWFINGEYGTDERGHVFDKHPDWALQTQKMGPQWYDLGKPEVRKFQSDLMVGCLRKYPIDGVHFDYIRYSGPVVCYCRHCQEEFARQYGFEPLPPDSAARFPMVTSVSSNPVVEPTTALVAAEFSDGIPAIALNELGKGKVLLINWSAHLGAPQPLSEAIERALARWHVAPDKVVVVNTAQNRAKYGDAFVNDALSWFRQMGFQAQAAREDRLAGLSPRWAVVLPGVYLIPEETAHTLERFVTAGGTLVFVDGPVFSMRSLTMQRLLGMRAVAKYFFGLTVIQPTGRSELVVSSGGKVDLARERLRALKWAEYRKRGITELVGDVHRRAKAARPEVEVTAAVFTPLASAADVYQDWPQWLKDGILDYAIPMAYTPDNDALARQIREWKSVVDPRLEQIIPGLSIHVPAREEPEDISLVISQVKLCAAEGAHGTSFFALDHLTAPLAKALVAGPFAEKVPAYRPPSQIQP